MMSTSFSIFGTILSKVNSSHPGYKGFSTWFSCFSQSHSDFENSPRKPTQAENSSESTRPIIWTISDGVLTSMSRLNIVFKIISRILWASEEHINLKTYLRGLFCSVGRIFRSLSKFENVKITQEPNQIYFPMTPAYFNKH